MDCFTIVLEQYLEIGRVTATSIPTGDIENLEGKKK
jgi:hypothetical protein